MDEEPQAFMLRTLQRYADTPHLEWEKMLGMHRALHLEKNAFLLRQGDQPDRLAFITSGIFRVFCITESGDEKTLSFRTRGQFLSAYTPYLQNRESWYSIQALTESDLICLSLEDCERLASGHSCWDKVVKEYVVSLFIEKEDRERSFLTEDAKTRYLCFKEKHPDLEQQIHQFHIASFLGISPVSLSRIRANLKSSHR
jgi:CRP-like cAMP-binding protein